MDNRSNKMLIDATHPEETRVVVLRNGRVEEFDFESATRRPLRGNIYLAKVTRVEPSLQAAFVEYGGNRHGFLAFSEIHPDYYQIPKADRDALLQEEVAAELEADQEADERAERMAHRSDRGDRDDRGGRDNVPGSGEQPSMFDSAPQGASDDHTDQTGPAGHAGDQPVAQAEASGLADPVHTEPAERHDRDAPAPTHDHHGHDHSHDHGPASAADHVAPASQAHDSDRDHTAEADADADRGHDHIEEVAAQTEEPEIIDGGGEQPVIADASEEMPERPRRPRRRAYKIQEVIKRRQIMLVQVVKEERGTKGAALTTYLSLAGRYTVLMPNTGRGGGISRKITQPQDRKRLKAIAQDLDVPEGMGLIIRTAGASRSLQEIRRDYDYLMRLWDSVRELTLASTAPSLVYEEGSLIKRSIRDQYTKDVDEVVVAGDDAFREAQDFMRMLMPSHAKNVILHDRPEPLFSRYPIVDRQLNALFSPQVQLKSGGYLVINQTEALVAIDINSGKSTREFSIEDTAYNTNMEAADEIARQVKLRDLAGLIVIDFIDMEEKRNNRAVERRLKDALRFDRARIQVGRISHFGLLEMSRQRMRTGMLEGSTSKCPHCEGTGIVRSVESVALAVLRGLEEHLQRDNRSSVNVHAHQDVALYILNHKRSFIADLERRYNVFVAVLASDKHQGANYHIERSALPPPRRQPERAAVTMHSAFNEQDAVEVVEDDGDDPRPDMPVIESEIESIDTGDGYEDDQRRDRGGWRGRDRNRDRDRGPRGDRGDRGDRGEFGDRGASGEGRDAGGDGHRGEEDGSGRRRGRRRGRGRDRDDRWRDRGDRGPRPAAAPGEHAGEVAAAQPLDDVRDGFDLEGVPADQPHEMRAPAPMDDDAPELINGDGIEGEATAGADAAAPADATGTDPDGRRRRRRGRRGGRRGRERAEGAEGAEGQDAEAGASDAATEAADPRDAAVSADEAAEVVDSRADVAVPADVPAPRPIQVEAPRHDEAPARAAETNGSNVAAAAAPEPEPEPAPERPIASEPVIVSDKPTGPARRGWWRSRGSADA